ncbi:MAG TPA: hypothetical protein VKE26_13665 [Xanthobacteraceae bacterium]|nr:hypothetical protein [Xanthobacteraceae bacterium]
MAEQNDIQQPTSQTATAAAAAGATDAAATEPASEALAAAPASAATSTVPEISAAPALVPTETPQIEISRSEGSESSAPEIKLPPAAQIAEPAPSMLRPFRRERPNAPPKAAPAKPAPAKPAQSKSRFPLLAATLGLSAGLGGAAGAALIPGLMKLAFPPAATVTPAQETAAEISAIRGLAARLASDLTAFRNTVELSNRTTAVQFGKLAERLDRAERAQADPSAKIAKIGEAVERLERRVADHNEITGTVNKPAPQVPAAEAKPKPVIIEDYVVRRVFDGVALIEGRRGIIEIEPGATLPGAGRVEEIRRQDGRWVVVTTKGLIVPAR